jgi:hypothetical protein
MIALSVVLLIPTGVLGQAFLSTTNGQISFAQRERDGLTVLKPALAALAQAVAGEQGEQVDFAALGAAVQAQPELGLDEQFAAVTAAQSSASTPAGRASWASVVADLITAVGNNSNLILDPDLDSFYVMDSLVVQLPSVLVSATEAAIGPKQPGREANVADQAVLAGGLARSAAALGSDLDTAVRNTSLPDLEPRLDSLTRATGVATSLQKTLSSTLATPAAADRRALGAAAAAAVDPAATALDTLLQRRIGDLSAKQRLILTISAGSLLLAAWFTIAVMQLTRRDATQTVAAVNALAQGDLRARAFPEGCDEFGETGRAQDTATTTLRDTVSAIGEHAVTLASASEELSGASSSIEAAAEQATAQAGTAIEATQAVHSHVDTLSEASNEFGASIGEIAQGAAEAARVAA